eukprot:TRINITY_DN10820_c0_g1_i1.p1 TRINITY_DN10820_c0_g1~~TRINITY_DN10820_c0_g1_i1.p1  ORF type:complete len:212 (+),score=22.02 TRINITY_DN10820_c0_g1_i1:601-1236(+)
MFELYWDYQDPGAFFKVQCKYAPEDFDVWLTYLKQFLTQYYQNFEKIPYNLVGGSGYMENEVNMYNPPDPSTPDFRKANRIFQQSQKGIGIVLQCCKDRFPGETLVVVGEPLKRPEDTCMAFWQWAPSPPQNYSEGCLREERYIKSQLLIACEMASKLRLPLYQTNLLSCGAPTASWADYVYGTNDPQKREVFSDVSHLCLAPHKFEASCC